MSSSVRCGSGPLLRRAAVQAAVLLLAAVVPALLTGWLHPRRPPLPGAAGSIREITVADAQALPGGRPVIWADARDNQAFARQHIPGAVHLSEAEWEQGLAGLVAVWRPGTPVVVYCASHSCDTSRAVASRLKRELALPDVFVLKGGWEEWLRRQK